MGIISFFDYVPERRFDNVPWTTIKVEEAPSQDGPWNQIDEFAIAEVDPDPSHPSARSWTTTGTTLDEGWYRVKFIDAQGNNIVTEPIQNIPPDPVEYLPSLSEVGLVSLGRTKDDVGNIQGTFNSLTTPDDETVQRLILSAGDDVRRHIGRDIPDDLIDDARKVVAVRTAMLIELSVYSSEVATDRSPYANLKQLYEELIADLESSVEAEEAGQSADNVVSGNFPAYGFVIQEPLMNKKM